MNDSEPPLGSVDNELADRQSARVPQHDDLVGLFVVEVGERQAWPFVQFCDNAPVTPREVRLYIDTRFEFHLHTGEVHRYVASDAGPAMLDLLELNHLAVTNAAVETSGLCLTFDDGRMLKVAATAEPTTIGDVWWLSPWLE